ncbi:MAG: transcriptional repressor LexA [Anaerolineales bacterium]
MSRTRKTTGERNNLSQRQQDILAFIEDFIAENGYPPTIREIGSAVNIGSTSVVNYNLNKLVREGFLERSQKVSRGLLLVQDTGADPQRFARARVMGVDEANVVSIPLIGQIVASKPVEFFGMHEDDDAVIELPVSLLGKVRLEDIFALKVSGNSMIDAMVGDGDVVVLRRQQTASNGDMVAAWLTDSNETTLKYFFQEGNRIRLQPANPQMEPIYVDAHTLEVQGRVLAVMRAL